MEGRCYGCASKFGFFTKEHACHKCGHAYCKNCLPHQAVIPGKDQKKKQNVCAGCYTLLQQPSSPTQNDNLKNEDRYSPPENFKKRVAALQQKERPSGAKNTGLKGVSAHDASSSSKAKQADKFKNLSPQDREIAMRLEKLQEERKKKEKPSLSVTEIEERLRKLRGLPPPSETNKEPIYQPPTNKTLHEQYDDLLNQMAEEAALDATLEGKTLPKPDVTASSHHPDYFRSGIGSDHIPPSLDEMKELEEDAKRLLGSHDGDGNPDKQQIPDEKAKRLAEESSKLIEAAKAELIQDEKNAQRDADIASRLACLQDRQPSSDLATDGDLQDIEEDEEGATQRLIQQLLEEDKLDETVAADGYEVSSKKPRAPSTGSHPISKDCHSVVEGVNSKPVHQQTPADSDQLPWCCICNEDAVLLCVDCDDDLYCQRCFREGHRDYGIESHRIKPFKLPSK